MTDVAIPAEGVRLRGLRRVEYQALVQTGLLDDARVELLGGEMVGVTPQGSPHAWAIARLTGQLASLVARGYEVRVQLPLAVDDMSLPEPDLAVTDRTTPDAHPVTAHVVIEVAHSSQTLDVVHKAPRYASAGVPLYVVLDLTAQEAIVHTAPCAHSYAHLERLGPDDEVTVLGVPLDLAELLSHRSS